LPEDSELFGRLRAGKARVGVIGLGYVGLPLAIAIAESNHTVVGIDLDTHVLETIMAGRSHIEDIDGARVAPLVAAERLLATSDYGMLSDADVVVIAVPTPIDVHRVPDLRFVTAASDRLAETMRRGALVCLESTTYPGTTEEILAAAFRRTGKEPGVDIHIAYSPERIDPGNRSWRLDNTPKLVAGLTPACLELALAFYGRFVERLVPLSSVRTAELAKLFENIFRVVNIALVNELQVICDGFDIDVWEVIEACSTKPFGFMPFYPGPGLGGHCVPVDPFYLAWKAREKDVNTEFIELAGRVNASMPRYVVGKLAELLNADGKSLQDARVLVLGVAYKRNTADVRESPALRVIELLEGNGAVVSYHDPHVPRFDAGTLQLHSIDLDPRSLAAQDAAIVIADHDAIDWGLVEKHVTRVLDTRDVIRRKRDQERRAASNLSASRGIA
jgi:UDP-N-acetyl-D-glucosamine dehydrogenase